MASQAVEQLLLPVLMSELLTDDYLLMSFLLREYSRDVDVVLLLQSVKVRKEEILKLEGCVHIIVPWYSDENFRQHFRLWRGIIEILAQMIGNCPEIPSPNQGPGRPPIPVYVQVLLTLWYLGHNDSYYEIAERFSIATSAAFNSVK